METIRWRDEDGVRWIQLEGELDHAACLDLKERWDEGLDAPGDVVLVLEGVTFLSSMGIGLMIAANRRQRERGRTLRLAGLRPAVRRVFEEMNLFSVFEEA